MYCDCIIIGGGPAGSTAARLMAEQGLSVTLLDKARFPRTKPCGGGLTNRCTDEIGLDLGDQVLHETTAVQAVLSPSRVVELSTEKSLARFVDRSSFDYFLLKKAEAEGAEIHQGISEADITYTNEGFVVKAESRVFRSVYLIGADGANSMINRRFGIVNRREYGKGIQVVVPRKRFDREPAMVFDFTAVPKGYGWIFPGKDSTCIGLYTTEPSLTGMSSFLDRYLESACRSAHRDLQMRTQILPFWGVSYRQPDLPVILTGDAAGFVDPLSGEGIQYAVRSAKIAAECVMEWIRRGRFNPDELQVRYEREIINVLKAGRRLADSFYNRKFPGYQILASRPGLRIFYLAFLRGEGYPTIIRKLPRYIRDMFSSDSPGITRQSQAGNLSQ